MTYRLVKGYFHLHYRSEFRFVGSRPDGDSMWFKPDDQALLTTVGDRDVDYNGGGFAQLRFEGIDALELHYSGTHQRVPECVDSRDGLLELAGFDEVTYAPSSTGGIDASVRTASPHPRRGYIFTRNVDPYGRPVAFVSGGNTNDADGSEVFLTASTMGRSFNARLANDGMAFPAYYTGLPVDLRDRITRNARRARRHGRGVWKVDVSMSGAPAQGEADLERLAQWPKLFRRLVSYFSDGNIGLGGFDAWLDANPDKDDSLWIISRGELGNMHDVVKVENDEVRMLFDPEDLVIVPR